MLQWSKLLPRSTTGSPLPGVGILVDQHTECPNGSANTRGDETIVAQLPVNSVILDKQFFILHMELVKDCQTGNVAS
ncbi:hypothetical protein DPEC_G00088560 [Dallia pectoralis]|uniref:Uncharacterized protein n=1 Tax=Dallia pectoralis TaxID=75939 RepID=A0ACC2H0G4_DALPE|nr:hypothetical protein DPEC_G00088560 [Dallia pectoralis]